MKSTLLRDIIEAFGISNGTQNIDAQITEDWEHNISRLVLGTYENILLDSIFIKLQNGLLYCCQPFHSLTSVEYL